MEEINQDYEFREEAIPFVVFNPQKGEFEISEESKEMLRHIEGPFGIVSVAGMYRTGKSYLLNKVLLDRKRSEHGFGVGPSINPCTKGLWVWGTPVSGYTPEGKPINVLIIDSEGIGALDEDSNHDTRIFSLCILLSSFFLYNSMGSIDESALQNLNLVINLTKHIHVKASANHDEVDSEEYSEYFPSFMWIVRDFTLQLVDADDESINSNQYLEKALEEQKGFSDKIEEKNRIRRLLKTFFKERQCFTMIRPVTNEDALQNLEEMDENDFRNEFVEQVTQLRRKVTHSVKPKTLNGKQLNPEMFITLAENYVYAINKGAVPNIENAWTYICQNESKKSLEKAISHFDEFVNEYIMQLPIEEDDLREYYEEARASAEEIFVTSSVGGVIDEHLKELKYELELKFSKLMQENIRESMNCCDDFLDTEYQEIDRRLQQGQYEEFIQFENELNEFKERYEHEGPPGPMRNVCYLRFINGKLIEAYYHFLREINDKYKLDKQLTEEKIKSLEKQIKELKGDLSNERDGNEQKINKLKNERDHHIATIRRLEESLRMEKETLTQRENELREKMKKDRSEYERKLELMKDRTEDLQKNENEKNIELMTERSNFEKEKALLQQELEHLNANYKELKGKQEKIRLEGEEEKELINRTAREAQNEYDRQISELNDENELLKEQIEENSRNHLQLQTTLEERIQELEELAQGSHTNDGPCTNEECQRTKEKREEEYDQLHSQFKEIQEDLTNKLYETEESLKIAQNSLMNEKKDFNKDKAILEQKVNFIENEKKSMEDQLDKKKKEIEAIHLSLVQNQDSGEELQALQTEVQTLRSQILQEKQDSELYIDNLKIEHQNRIDEFNEKIADLNNELNLNRSEYEQSVEDLKEKIDELTATNEELTDAQGSHTSRSMFDEQDSKKDNQIKDLEDQIIQLKKSSQDEIEIHQDKFDHQLDEMKKYYENEKSLLDSKINEIKEKQQTKIKSLMDDHDVELDIKNNHLAEIEEHYEYKIQDIENSLHNKIEGQKQEILLQKHKIINLEENLKEKNQQLSQESEKSKAELESQVVSANQDKRNLQEELDKTKQTLLQCEMELDQTKEKLSRFRDDYSQKYSEVEEEKEGLEKQKEEYEGKIKVLVHERDELEKENQKITFENDRTISLLRQKLEFAEKNSKDSNSSLEKDMENLKQSHNVVVENLKTEYAQKIKNYQTQIEKFKKKIEDKSSEIKMYEETIGNRCSELEKDNAILKDKCKLLENQQEEEKSNYESKMNNQYTDLIEENKNLTVQLADYKEEIEKLNDQLYDSKTDHDKDNALMNDQIIHFKNAYENQKKDLAEDRERFKKTLDQMKKKQEVDKNKENGGNAELFKTVDSMHKENLAGIHEKYKEKVTNYMNSNKELKLELKELKEKSQEQQRELRGWSKAHELEIKKLKTSEEKARSELTTNRLESEAMLKKLNSQLEEERENSKNKINECEDKLKEYKSKYNEFKFENQRLLTEKSFNDKSWNEKLQEAYQDRDLYKNKYERAMKDAEKNRGPMKYNNKRPYGAERSSSNFAKGSLRPSLNKFPHAASKGQSSTGSSL